jgi:MinD-like ATPase involved in chromosome partitioning or flagellar assembly
MDKLKRVTLFAGHYGSGKTNVAVNYALMLKKKGLDVAIADLDIVNPYFRTKDSQKELEENGITLISSLYAGSNVDLPALPAEIYSLVDIHDRYAIFDIGGDDRGATALGRYADAIKEENDYELLLVLNRFRPLSKTPELAMEIMHEIETTANMRFTGIVNDSNLGEETTAEDVLGSVEFAKKVSEMAGIPIRFTTVTRKIYDEVKDKIENLMVIHLQDKIV